MDKENTLKLLGEGLGEQITTNYNFRDLIATWGSRKQWGTAEQL